jgi:competence protein ComEA
MNKRRIESFVKSYFYFSRAERKGIIALVILLLLVVAAVYNIIYARKKLVAKVEILAAAIPAFKHTDIQDSPAKPYPKFTFDPNTATSAELKQLGFSEKNISTLRKYLDKGGRFRKASDLEKMYGLDPLFVSELMPYIIIPGKDGSPAVSRLDTNYTKRRFSTVPLELNGADTLDLNALYRIGPSMARRIVEYRTRLGGFLALEQLNEIWGFDEDILYDLRGRIWVDASKATIYEVNTVTADELKTHPYFKYRLANAIVNYRHHHGPYRELADLKKIVIVNDSIYANITRYLRIDKP